MHLDINIVYWKDKRGVYLRYYDFSAPSPLNRLSAGDVIGKTDFDLYPAEIAESYREQELAVIAKNQALTYETQLPDSTLILQVTKQPLHDDVGNIIGIIASVNNHTAIIKEHFNNVAAIKNIAHEAVGQALPETLSNIEYVQFLRDYLENIIALMPGHVYWLDKDNTFLGCNNIQAQNAHLTSRKEIAGKKNSDLPWKEQAKELDRINKQVIETGETYAIEEFAIMANGPGIYLTQKVPLRDPRNNIIIIGMVGISFDITERKKAEEERLNLILKASNMGTWTWDFTDDSFIHDYLQHEIPYRFNSSFNEAITRAYPADQDILRKAMLEAYQENKPLDVEYRLHWLDGKLRYIAMRGKIIENRQGNPIHMVGVCWDITHRKELEKALQEQQVSLAHVARLNAMGELASTLAHELNQPLTAITNFTNGCLLRLKNGNFRVEELVTVLEKTVAQSTRAGAIIHRMKNFIRKGELYYETIDLNSIIQETVTIMRYDPAANAVNIQLDLTSSLPKIEIDKIQIGQVVLNLLRNAIEATHQQTLTNEPYIIIKTLQQNNEICVDVIDNGPGCPADLSQQLFTPYFTTKKTGMGMGLAICRTIIEAHHGYLTLLPDSPSGGAWFRFCLPLEREINAAAKQLVD